MLTPPPGASEDGCSMRGSQRLLEMRRQAGTPPRRRVDVDMSQHVPSGQRQHPREGRAVGAKEPVLTLLSCQATPEHPPRLGARKKETSVLFTLLLFVP